MGGVQDLSGKRRAFAPDWSGSLGLDLTAPVGANQLRVNPSVSFSSKYFASATADPLIEQPGYAKLDLRVGFGPQDGHWEAALIGRNLTDVYTANFRLGVPAGDGSVIALADRGRSVAIQISFKN